MSEQLKDWSVVSILLVCMGNICRSPLAEGVLRAQAEAAGLAEVFEFDSAGTLGAHAGEAPDSRAQLVAARRGYDISRQRARRVVVEDFRRFDLVLAMDRSNLAVLERMCPTPYLPKLKLFMEVAQRVGEGDDEVPDPYYGGEAGFERVLDMCEKAARAIVASYADPAMRGRS